LEGDVGDSRALIGRIRDRGSCDTGRMNEKVQDSVERPTTGANESLAIVVMEPNGGGSDEYAHRRVPVP
jgi:hypothetical protein